MSDCWCCRDSGHGAGKAICNACEGDGFVPFDIFICGECDGEGHGPCPECDPPEED